MKTMNTRSTLAALGAALILAGCNLAPRYREPQANASGQFKEAAPGGTQAQGWKVAEPRDAVLRGNWWQMYGDPRLDVLEERVAISNQTVAAAEANYRAARALASEAQAALFPAVNAAPSVIRSRSSAAVASGGGGSSGGGTGPRTYFTLPLDASYELDLWGSVRNSAAQSSYAAQAGAAVVATALLSTQATLAQDYFSLRAVDEQRRILDTTLADYEARPLL